MPDVREVLEKELLAATTLKTNTFSRPPQPAPAYHTNRTDLAINGIFGAGKTRTMALLLAFLAPSQAHRSWSWPRKCGYTGPLPVSAGVSATDDHG